MPRCQAIAQVRRVRDDERGVEYEFLEVCTAEASPEDSGTLRMVNLCAAHKALAERAAIEVSLGRGQVAEFRIWENHMPDKDVLAAVAGASESLLHKATDNLDICQRFMALVALCAIEANGRGCSMGGVQVGNIVMNGHRLVAKVTFSRLEIPRSITLANGAARLVDFLHGEAEGLWLFIQKNPDFIKYLGQLVTIVDLYCKDKGLDYGEVSFSHAFMDKEDNIVLEIDRGA